MSDIIQSMPLMMFDHYVNFRIKNIENGNLAINMMAIHKQIMDFQRYSWHGHIGGGFITNQSCRQRTGIVSEQNQQP